MSITLNSANPTTVVERDQLINKIRNKYGVANQLGLFENRYKSQKTITIGYTTDDEVGLLEDRNYEDRHQSVTGYSRQEVHFKIPRFPIHDAITPADIDGQVAWEQVVADVSGAIQLETIGNIRAQKMARNREAIAQVLEYARMKLISTGDVYMPNATAGVKNIFTEYGVTQPIVPFALNSSTTNPLEKCEEAHDTALDGLEAGVVSPAVIAFCGKTFFNKMVTNGFVTNMNLQIGDQLARQQLTDLLPSGMGLDRRYKVFEYGGIFWIKVPDSYKGVAFIPDAEARVFPMADAGMLFATYFAPENTFSAVNKVAQEVYWHEKVIDDRLIEIKGESNFANWCFHPKAIVKCTIA